MNDKSPRVRRTHLRRGFFGWAALAFILASNPAFAQDPASVVIGSGPWGYYNSLGAAVITSEFTGNFGNGGEDVVIGVPAADVNGVTDAGRIVVLKGDNSLPLNTGPGWQGTHWVISESSGGIAGTAESGDRFGETLASGNFNGDEFDEIVVGIPRQDVGGDADAGAITVILGGQPPRGPWSSVQLTRDTSGIAGSADPNDGFGRALAAGDFNGDGYDDLAIGIPGDDTGATNAGAVSVLYGSQTGLTTSGSQLWHQDSTNVNDSAEADDAFGAALTTGDLDGDGYDDLAIGVPGEDYGSINRAGRVAVLYGGSSGLSASGDQSWDQALANGDTAPEASDAFGSSLAIGDLDGNGYGDLAVGVPGEDIGQVSAAGLVNIIYGSASGLTSTGNQSWNQDSAGIKDAAEELDWFGAALAVGDFDLDNIDDLVIGVPGEAVGPASGAGSVNLLFGSTAGLTATDDRLIRQSPEGEDCTVANGEVTTRASAFEGFGSSVAVAIMDTWAKDQLVVGVPGEWDFGDATPDTGNANGTVNLFYPGPTGACFMKTWVELTP